MSEPSAESLQLILQILLLIFFTLLNGFFSAAEMSLVSLSRSKVEQKAADGEKNYQNLLKVLNQPSNFLATIQVGITFIQLLVGASLTDSLTQKLVPLMGDQLKWLAQIIVLLVLTYVSIVLGELYPKRIAQNLKDKLALIVARPIQIIAFVLRPFVWLLASSTNLLSRITHFKFDDADDNMTRDEIEYILSNNDKALDEEEREMLSGVFSLDELVARELMVPRVDAFMVDIEDDTKENIEKILEESYSRIPVYEDDKDKIIGILHTKRLLIAAHENGFDKIDFREIMNEPLFVPETINVDDLLRALKESHNQMAVLLNEYGGVEGIVTLEDLLEEIVGEIEDESDVAQKDFVKLDENLYVVQGRMTLNDFNEEFETQLDSDDVDTIAGYFLDKLNSIPDRGEQVSIDIADEETGDHLTLTSLEIEDKRIIKLRVEFKENLTKSDEE